MFNAIQCMFNSIQFVFKIKMLKETTTNSFVVFSIVFQLFLDFVAFSRFRTLISSKRARRAAAGASGAPSSAPFPPPAAAAGEASAPPSRPPAPEAARVAVDVADDQHAAGGHGGGQSVEPGSALGGEADHAGGEHHRQRS